MSARQSSEVRAARPSVTAVQYARLRDEIVSGAIAPGTQLFETSISDRLGVSRTPVREALGRLEAEGLLERVGRSYRVRSATPEEILDIYEVRIALEAAAAAAAARRRSEIDLARLQAAVEIPPGTELDDDAKNFASNERFHALVWSASQNLFLQHMLANVSAQIRLLDNLAVANRGVIEQTFDEHAEIVESIRARDDQRASALMSTHLGRTRDLRLRTIAQGPAS